MAPSSPDRTTPWATFEGRAQDVERITDMRHDDARKAMEAHNSCPLLTVYRDA
jgi:hypothetical protein